MSLFKISGLYDKNSNKLFVFKNNKESDKLKNLLMGAIVSTLRTQSEADYLLLAEYIPDEFIELMRYKDTERLIKGIARLDDAQKIEKAVKSLADFLSVAVNS